MSTLLLDEPETVHTSNVAAADRLRTTMAAVRVGITWFGTRKSLSIEQKAQAAESFGAQGQFLTAGKKLLDSSHPAFKAVTAVRGRVLSHWKGMSLPYPRSRFASHPSGRHRLLRRADDTVADGARRSRRHAGSPF